MTYPTRTDLQAELKHYHTLIRTAQKAVRLNQQIAIAHDLNANADKKLLDDLILERNKIAERLINES
jgi:hypothetical protein